MVTVTSGLPHFGEHFLLEFSIFTLLCGSSNGKGTSMENAFAVFRATLDMKVQLPGPAMVSLVCFLLLELPCFILPVSSLLFP